jgi:hypothetical protein
MSELEKKNLLINPSGNVGIGTDNPTSILDISCNSNNNEDGIIIKNKWNSNNQTTFLKLGITDNNWVSMRANTALNDKTYLTFSTQTGTSNWVDTMILREKYVGIGTDNPLFPLHITTIGSTNFNYTDSSLYQKGSVNHNLSDHNSNTSAYFDHDICAKNFGARSDKRIKTDISLIIDDTALNQVNALESYEYHYIDPEQRRTMKTIGFIAQEVKGVIPNAVTLLKNYIPDEMRIITNPKWEGNTLTIPDVDMSSNMTGKAKFYVSNDHSGNDEICKEVEIKEIHTHDSTPLFPKTKFVADFDQKWNNVFFYGKEVTDFHIIDKAQIFALHHSAIQELSRQNDAKTLEITNLKEKVNTLEDKVNTLEDKLNKVMHHLGMY